ncbi:hypothetical protein [Halomonas organivorans]|uniref:Uncharacterized protein n=1 Tax=Halomonas organivorans TaxID=257772 RepID=A0A7W5G6B7_9GAMM|nr:hypothetical protein [Halomonas organivorans]MBB3141752.1 hypothetical protein [Halomonas organivorans]
MSMYMNGGSSAEKARGRSRWWMAFLLSGSLLSVAGAANASGDTQGILSAGTHDIYYRGEVLSNDGMADLRGGFKLAGMDMSFGATLSTMINDKVRYITQVAFDNAGTRVLSSTLEKSGIGSGTVTQIGPSGGSGAPGQGTGGGVGGIGNAGSSSGVGNSVNAADIRGQLNLAGLSDFSGVLFSDSNGGMTAALHRITRNAIVSSLSTTASGLTISNDVDVSVHVMNIGEVKASRQRAMILNSLQGLPR